MRRGFRKEAVITYLFISLVVGVCLLAVYFLEGNLVGFAVFTPGPGEGQTTLTLQDADTDNLGDAYVDANFQGIRNYGVGTALRSQQNPYQRVYIKFDISQVPSNQLIDDSKLCLYLYDDQSAQTISASHVYVHNWVEGSEDNADVSGQDYTTNISWNNQPCGVDFDDSVNCNLTAEDSITNDGTLDGTWQCWDVTNAVLSEFTSGDKNVSLVLYTGDLGNPDLFYSKEYTTDTSLIPYLNITYHSANLAPSITLVEPQNTLYLSNESLSLNFTVSDSDDNLDACWYTLDSGVTNTTLANCQNTTFDIAEGSHTLTIYANDSANLESSDSVSFEVDSTGVSVSITEPTGTKTSRTAIPLSYTTVGNDLTCWYNVKTSIGGAVIENTTLTNCSSSTFDVSADGDYILNLFANSSLGISSSDSSAFSVSTGGGTVVVSGGGGGGGGTIIVPEVLVDLDVSAISDLVVDSGKTEKIIVGVENSGTTFLNDCKLEGRGSFGSWILSNSEVKSLNVREAFDFKFDLIIPDNLEAGIYPLNVLIVCKEISGSVDFSVEMVDKKINFEILKIERISDEEVQINYLLEELYNLDQEVELQFLLFDSNNERVAEVTDIKFISANSKEEFEILILVDASLEGDLNLLANLNSETYSTFVQEDLVLGAPISGFTFFGDVGTGNKILNIVIFLLFLGVVAFLAIKSFKKSKKKK